MSKFDSKISRDIDWLIRVDLLVAVNQVTSAANHITFASNQGASVTNEATSATNEATSATNEVHIYILLLQMKLLGYQSSYFCY